LLERRQTAGFAHYGCLHGCDAIHAARPRPNDRAGSLRMVPFVDPPNNPARCIYFVSGRLVVRQFGYRYYSRPADIGLLSHNYRIISSSGKILCPGCLVIDGAGDVGCRLPHPDRPVGSNTTSSSTKPMLPASMARPRVRPCSKEWNYRWSAGGFRGTLLFCLPHLTTPDRAPSERARATFRLSCREISPDIYCRTDHPRRRQ